MWSAVARHRPSTRGPTRGVSLHCHVSLPAVPRLRFRLGNAPGKVCAMAQRRPAPNFQFSESQNLRISKFQCISFWLLFFRLSSFLPTVTQPNVATSPSRALNPAIQPTSIPDVTPCPGRDGAKLVLNCLISLAKLNSSGGSYSDIEPRLVGACSIDKIVVGPYLADCL